MMFLHAMTDKQKNLFMKLAIKAAEANGVVEFEEKNMLKAYGIEMGIKPIYETDSKTEDIIAELKALCDEKTKRIIVFEILGIMISDSEFDEMEKSFVDEIVSAFSIPSDQKQQMLELLNEYAAVFKKISNLVLQQ